MQYLEDASFSLEVCQRAALMEIFPLPISPLLPLAKVHGFISEPSRILKLVILFLIKSRTFN
ncbi:unnamed protein product [Prunus armeniaca]|uniref:Uncharacterized protein n=1 Tax=Prunus armeniaca TaxID=36596 RepID=A0A6J5W478_PRUAR|nr:unnamed protein product [Prunus armeniaca]